jgi:hypothetical protein
MNQQETRLNDAKLGSAIDDACSKLPDGFEILISLERGSGVVILVDAEGDELVLGGNDGTIADEIQEALQYAIDIEASATLSESKGDE